MEPVIVTDQARSKLKELCENNGEQYIFFTASKKGCSGHTYKLDFVKEDQVKWLDEQIDLGEAKLVVDGENIFFLLGTTIDYKTDSFGSHFSFDNPKIQATCGCGESFHF